MDDQIKLTDPTLAATLELIYLRPTLLSLHNSRPCAIDVGAHRGDVTEALAEMGFRVMAIEPQPTMARRLFSRFSSLLDQDLLHIERCAASNRRGVGTMYLGSASTVNTLERDWTQVAFPEEFQHPEKIEVPLQTLAELAQARGFEQAAYVKVDVEGHEFPALEGLFQGAMAQNPPAVVMFEANQRFPDAVKQCLSLLNQFGYGTFDIFIREGIAPIAGERFTGTELPKVWTAGNSHYFYANVIAYHHSVNPADLPSDPNAFVESYQLEAARDVLRRGLALERSAPVLTHDIWSKARHELREHLMQADWRAFLAHPVCKHMFFRGRWGAGQDHELAALNSSEFGRELLCRHQDPATGNPRLSEKLPGLSTNMLGMLYYLSRVHQQFNAQLPDRVMEIGGGYGAFALTYLKEHPSASYVIVDLPEMLAIQHYFLTLALPQRKVSFTTNPETAMEPGQILLVPVALMDQLSFSCDLLFSTFGFSELPRELQQRIENRDYFGASRIFLAGQFADEFPDINLVHHNDVLAAARQRFAHVQVEPFHTGKNYLLLGSKSAA